MGVVSGCCYREIDRFPHNITYPCSLVLAFFLHVHPYVFVKFFLFVLVYVIFVQYRKQVNVAQRTFKIVQKLRSHGHGAIIISTRTSTM